MLNNNGEVFTMNLVKKVPVALLILLLMAALAVPAYAAETAPSAETAAAETETADESDSVGLKAIAVCIAIGLAAAGGALGMGIVGGKAADGISRQPDMEGKIRTTLMLDLVFNETAIIYALLVFILVIFVL